MSHKSVHFNVPFRLGESVEQHQERVERIWVGAYAHGRQFWGQVELVVTDLLNGIYESDEHQANLQRKQDAKNAHIARVARRLQEKEAAQQARKQAHKDEIQNHAKGHNSEPPKYGISSNKKGNKVSDRQGAKGKH